MNKKERILILFDGAFLAYSPTTLQLYDELIKNYDVTVIAQHPEGYNGQAAPIDNVLYHRVYLRKDRYFFWALFQLMLLFSKTARLFKKNKLTYKDYFFRYFFIKRTIRNNNFKRIICVDNRYLFFCSVMGVKVDFMSFELCDNEHLIPLVNRAIINCVIIQSEERYKYLFGEEKLRLFYVQNAPPFTPRVPKKVRKSLIYGGSTIKILGFYHCLDFIRAYPDEKLTVQGALFKGDKDRVNTEYKDLLQSNRLAISDRYIESNEMIEFLSDFEIGFCFYYFDDPFMQKHYFNYMSAPSGKMFKYLAAGVPVVCSDISGFAFVKEFKCGVLISELTPEAIKQAIETIRSDYDTYVQQALKAAEHFAFDKSIIPYLKFISE